MESVKDWAIDDLLRKIRERYEKEGLTDNWESEKPGIEAALNNLNTFLPDEQYVPVDVLGVGGSGIVIQLRDTQFPKIDKALKFPRPVDGKIRLVAEMLNKEIQYLAELRSVGIVRIIYQNNIKDIPIYENLPFYIMEYVEGESSKEYCKQATVTAESFINILVKTSNIIRDLHSTSRTKSEQFVHLDIKAENILITSAGDPVLIDLGTCKRNREDDDKTIVACTRPNAHPELMRLLVEDPTENNRAKGEIRRSEIDPKWDLWAFGLTILDWLGVDREDGKVTNSAVYHKLEPYTRKYVMLLVARLLSYSLKTWLSDSVGLKQDFLQAFPIEDSNQLCDVLDRLNNPGILDKIAELKQPSSGSYQADRGAHVHLTESLIAVIEHPLFRRLNSITQLGFVSQVFPNAKHTRREHCLGVYATTATIIRSLYKDSYSPLFRQVISLEDCKAILLAALLHDVGQFPLAHELEEIDEGFFNHAELTKAMISGEWVRKRKGSKKIRFESFEHVLGVWGISANRILDILSAKASNTSATIRDKLLRSILSGPIDGDKLTYLCNDGTHTGVPYPQGIDHERLLRCITVVVVNEGGARDVPMIGIHAKGKVAAEFLTLARYAMFCQVYWHHTVRAQKAMLSRAIHSYLSHLKKEEDIEKNKYDFIRTITELPKSLYSEQIQLPLLNEDKDADSEFKTYNSDLSPTDAATIAYFMRKMTKFKKPEKKLLEDILARRLFKRLWVISYDMEPRRWHEITSKWDNMNKTQRHAISYEFEKSIASKLQSEEVKSVTSLKSDDAMEIIENYVAAEIPWLLIDIPGNRPGADVGLYYVLEGQRRQLRKNNKAVGELQKCEIWEKYAKDIRKVAGKIRIFCDPKIVDTIEVSVTFDNGLNLLEDVFVKI